MTNNLMEQYVKNTKKYLENFTKTFLAEKYNKEISDEYISTYIDSRIYNFGESGQKFFYRRIYASLMDKKNELKKDFPKIDEKILDDNLKIYQFILYIDGVRPISDLEEFAKSICENREKIVGIKAVKSFESRMLKSIKNYIEEKENFLKSYETTDFLLDIQKYTLINDTYKVDLNYNFKIPYIYSNKIINEVFNDGVINEDKLIIEYMLLTIICIKEINKGNFSTKYLVDFADSLYKKQTKLKQTLKVINNPAIQDKVFLKVKYKDFEENKELIYSLMQDGFRFAIIVDDTFNPTMMNLKKLSVFKYLLVSTNSKNYDKIKENEIKLNNIIIYDL